MGCLENFDWQRTRSCGMAALRETNIRETFTATLPANSQFPHHVFSHTTILKCISLKDDIHHLLKLLGLEFFS